MVGICKNTKYCSVYKNGQCLGCDCSCIIEGTDERDIIREITGDPSDYDNNK